MVTTRTTAKTGAQPCTFSRRGRAIGAIPPMPRGEKSRSSCRPARSAGRRRPNALRRAPSPSTPREGRLDQTRFRGQCFGRKQQVPVPQVTQTQCDCTFPRSAAAGGSAAFTPTIAIDPIPITAIARLAGHGKAASSSCSLFRGMT
jgi:hypothetical protein